MRGHLLFRDTFDVTLRYPMIRDFAIFLSYAYKMYADLE